MDSYSIAALVFFAGHIVVTIRAFQDEILSGVLCLFLPLYLPYYTIRRIHAPGRTLFILIYFGCGLYISLPRSLFRSVNPCDLVTQEEATGIMNTAVGAPASKSKSIAGHDAEVCEFRLPNQPLKGLTVSVVSKCDGFSETVRQYRASTVLKDSADEAYLRRGAVYARKGSTCVVVETFGAPDAILTMIKIETLTQTVLERLAGKKK